MSAGLEDRHDTGVSPKDHREYLVAMVPRSELSPHRNNSPGVAIMGLARSTVIPVVTTPLPGAAS